MIEFDFGKDLSNIIVTWFVPFLILGVIALVVVIGIRFAMASGAKERAEAKKRLMSMVSVCLIFLYVY